MTASTEPMDLPTRSNWWLLASVLVVAGLAFGLNIWNNYESTDLEARELLKLQAKNVGDDLGRHLKVIDRVLTDVRANMPHRTAQGNGRQITEQHLKVVARAMEGVRTLTVFDAAGTITLSSRPEVTGQNFADRAYFQMARRETNPAALNLSAPFQTVLGVNSMIAIKSIIGPDGKFAGAVSVALEPDDFKSLLEGVRTTADLVVGIVHGEGKVFVFSPESASPPNANTAQPGTFFTRHMESGQNTSVMTGWSKTMNSERLLAAHTVKPDSLVMNQSLLVSVSRNLPLVYASWRKQSYELIVLFGAVALISTVSLYLHQRRHRVALDVEHKLHRSDTQFTAFFDSAMVGMAVTSLEKSWIRVNPALCDILGYSREILSQKTWADLTHPEDLAADVAEFERLLSGESNEYSMEKRFIRSSGEIVHAFIAVRAVRNASNDIDFFAAIVENITDRRKAEQQTRSTLHMMQRFIDCMPGLVYIKDEDSRIVMANQGFAHFGFDKHALIGKTTLEIIPGPIGEKIARDEERIQQSGKSEVMIDELRGSFYESSRFAIDGEDGQRLLGGITLDVTQRQRYVERAQALLLIDSLGGKMPEKEFLTQGLELAERLTGSGIAFLHFVNEDQQTIELVTWSSKALKGCTAVHESHYPIGQAGIWADCFRQKQAVTFNDYPSYLAKKGLPEGHAPLQRLISVPVIEEDQVRIMLGMGNKRDDYDDFDIDTVQLIGNDLWRIARRVRVEAMLQQKISELTLLNQRLSEAQGQLLQSEKLAAIGQLAAGVAHEINNPIGFVRSNLGTLADYVDDLLSIDRVYMDFEDQLAAREPTLFARVKAIKNECDHDFIVGDLKNLLHESGEGLDRVIKIVQDLKGFSRIGESGWLWADLHMGLESTLNIVHNEVKYKAEVVRELGDLPEVYCIPSQINQVFMNLLLNAAQAIESHGVITLRSGCDGAWVWIEIRDNGCGIAPATVGRIFEPFFTTKPVGKGTGLGLSLAWGIVQRHLGTIDVQSEVGKGTTFRIRLPIAGPGANQAKCAHPPKFRHFVKTSQSEVLWTTEFALDINHLACQRHLSFAVLA
ncbi:MAG TPA: PAS domain S-box protein [Rhodoferax sp.]|nr:PAS domain S-box protein [Rhodoferax sp.]